MAEGRTLDELVDDVFARSIGHESAHAVIQHLCNHFGLAQADAELALDRTYGGVVRAATGNLANCPAKDKDPVAWISFHKSMKRPEVIGVICPQFPHAPRQSWWRRLLS